MDGHGWAWMGMDGVEAIGVWMMAWSSFAGERASELQAVGREGPRSKDRRGRARSAAVGMLGPMPLLCRGGGHDSIECVGGRRAHTGQSSAQVEHTPNGTTPAARGAASRSMCAPSLLHCAAPRCRPPTPQPSPPASCCSPTRRAPAGRFVCRARCVART